MKPLSLITLCCLLAACSHSPEPILYGKDACTHCKMTIMDKRFATEVISVKGKIYKFDAVECMAGFLRENPAVANDPESSLLVNDFGHPGTFSDARKAWYLHDASLASPMGGNLAAFINRRAAEAAQQDSAAIVSDWPGFIKQNR